MEPIGWLIVAISAKEETRMASYVKEYVAIDSASGGYPYWTNCPGSIKWFSSFEEASKYWARWEKFLRERASGVNSIVTVMRAELKQ
jgi:ribosomal protein L31